MILTIPQNESLLHTPSTPLSKEEWLESKYLIKIMKEVLLDTKAMGLASPQMGLLKNFFLYRSSENHIELVINPKIIKTSKQLITNEEGCLSCPEVSILISRFKEIKVSYINQLWQLKERVLRNTSSIIFQHEYDHLLGKLIVDN